MIFFPLPNNTQVGVVRFLSWLLRRSAPTPNLHWRHLHFRLDNNFLEECGDRWTPRATGWLARAGKENSRGTHAPVRQTCFVRRLRRPVAALYAPVLLEHIQIPPRNLTIMDFDNPNDAALRPWIERGVTFVKDRITPANLGATLGLPAPGRRRSVDRPGVGPGHRLLQRSSPGATSTASSTSIHRWSCGIPMGRPRTGIPPN